MFPWSRMRRALRRARTRGERSMAEALSREHERTMKGLLSTGERTERMTRIAHERRIRQIQEAHEREIRGLLRGYARKEKRLARLEELAMEKARRWDRMMADASAFLARAGQVVQTTSERHRALLSDFARGAADADCIADLQGQLADIRAEGAFGKVRRIG